jgi:uncharacterized membrane protein
MLQLKFVSCYCVIVLRVFLSPIFHCQVIMISQKKAHKQNLVICKVPIQRNLKLKKTITVTEKLFPNKDGNKIPQSLPKT